MIEHDTWEGVQSLIDNYIALKRDDDFIIAFTADAAESAAWVAAAAALREITAKKVPMLPIEDHGFGARLAATLPDPTALKGRLVILTLERETMSHDDVVRNATVKYGPDRCLVVRSISSSGALFSSALRASPDELSQLNTQLLERFMPANSLRVTTRGGTDLRIKIDAARHRWISNRGRGRRGQFLILPAGEVATYPHSIEGTLVADFAFNVNALTERSARLDDHPVTVTIRDGRAVDYVCEDDGVMRFLTECFQTHCAFNVGELGFGTNRKVLTPIDLNSHINERRPGIHLGFGQHNQSHVVDYQCAIHLDLIANGGLVWVDQDPVPIDLENVVPSLNQHPDRTFDQDVFSATIEDLDIDDCCGVLTRERLVLFSERGNDESTGEFLGAMGR